MWFEVAEGGKRQVRKVGSYFLLQNLVDDGCDVGNELAVNLIVLRADETALKFLLS